MYEKCSKNTYFENLGDMQLNILKIKLFVWFLLKYGSA